MITRTAKETAYKYRHLAGGRLRTIIRAASFHTVLVCAVLTLRCTGDDNCIIDNDCNDGLVCEDGDCVPYESPSDSDGAVDAAVEGGVGGLIPSIESASIELNCEYPWHEATPKTDPISISVEVIYDNSGGSSISSGATITEAHLDGRWSFDLMPQSSGLVATGVKKTVMHRKASNSVVEGDFGNICGLCYSSAELTIEWDIDGTKVTDSLGRSEIITSCPE